MYTKRLLRIKALAAVLGILSVCSLAAPFEISVAELENKIKGGWLGKTAGVCTGAPTEFGAQGQMYTGSLNLNPDMSGGFWQDDLYVQLTFIAAMDAKLGQPDGIFAATMIDYGEAFANSGYDLWWANDAGRNNIRSGILPPLSGMWGETADTRKNNVADAIDFQIECDWIGFMCPAMPVTAVRLCDSVGHVMNYGDGLYGGYFVSAMSASAFRLNDVHAIVKDAMQCLPKSSDYYKIINDLVTYHDDNPSSTYEDCWQYITYTKSWLNYKSSPCIGGSFNIMANLNGAYIAIGVMYGDGDIKNTIEYATRCGQDSDCNPANAGAVLGAMIGYDALPADWKNSIEQYPDQTYSSSNYTYGQLITSSINRAQKCIEQMGGTLSGTTYTIAAEEPAQPRMLEVYGADPVDNPDFIEVAVRDPARKNRGPAMGRTHSGVVRFFDLTGRHMAETDFRSGARAGVIIQKIGPDEIRRIVTR